MLKRFAILALPLLALCAVMANTSLASNTDAQTCHHELDGDRGKLSGVTDATKKAQAYAHLKAAYGDEQANNYTGCISELKAAEALMQ